MIDEEYPMNKKLKGSKEMIKMHKVLMETPNWVLISWKVANNSK